MTILVTGTAGFIGCHVALRLLREGHSVVGLDNMTSYYDVGLKQDRLKLLTPFAAFSFVKGDLADAPAMKRLFGERKPETVVHLAAQAGVRHSLEAPQTYIQSNLVGFANILEECRHHAVRHLVYASSSSVYGLNNTLPFTETDRTDRPASLYAATKRGNELMAHSYSHLFRLPTTGLRFFTVYGPWGRPDMAPFLFTKAILEGKPVQLFNNGNMQRDFTYIDDIVDGVCRITAHIPEPGPETGGSAPYALYNIGNNRSVPLERFVSVLEESLGKKAVREYLPMQPGDVQATYADIDALHKAVGFTPATSVEEGVPLFAAWYKQYYKIA